MLRGEEIHGEIILDGNASGGLAVVLYKAGSVVVRTLGAKEILHVSDVQLLCETGADVSLCADGKVAGEYLLHGTVDAKGGIIRHYEQPYACAPGTGLTFYGATTNINSCIIEGFLTGA